MMPEGYPLLCVRVSLATPPVSVPQDPSKRVGFFQLTQPEGVRLIQRCKQQARTDIRSVSIWSCRMPILFSPATLSPSRASVRSFGDVGGGSVCLRLERTQGFHPHDDTPSGNPLYTDAGHVQLDERVGFQVLDLR